MQIEQKYGNYQTSFTFGETKLDYVYSNHENKIGGSVPYEKIPTQYTRRRSHKYWAIKYVGLFFMLAGIMLARIGLVHGGRNSNDILLTFIGIGAFLFFMSWWGNSPTLSVFYAEPPINILDDAQHQTIMDELSKRRTASTRRKFSEVNFLNPAVDEYEKFRHLRNEQVITEREFNDAVSKLLAAHRKSSNYVS